MKGLIEIQRDFLGTKAIFQIKLKNHSDVYMSVPRTPYMNEERFVIVVNAQKFLELWKSDPYNSNPTVSNGNPNTWINDRKYPLAVKGFSHGYKNPVPVANVVCQKTSKRKFHYKRKHLLFKELDYIEEKIITYADFNNGITRTIWLLTYGAEYFPVECNRADGAKLRAVPQI
jgi:hypothetical protein